MLFQCVVIREPGNVVILFVYRQSYLNIKLSQILDKAGVSQHDNYVTPWCTVYTESRPVCFSNVYTPCRFNVAFNRSDDVISEPVTVKSAERSHNPGLCPKRLRKITKIIIQSRRNISWDLDRGTSRGAVRTTTFPTMGSYFQAGEGEEAAEKYVYIRTFQSFRLFSLTVLEYSEQTNN